MTKIIWHLPQNPPKQELLSILLYIKLPSGEKQTRAGFYDYVRGGYFVDGGWNALPEENVLRWANMPTPKGI